MLKGTFHITTSSTFSWKWPRIYNRGKRYRATHVRSL